MEQETIAKSKYAIRNIREMCDQVKAYTPDIVNPHRDAFVEKASGLILDNQYIKQILEMKR